MAFSYFPFVSEKVDFVPGSQIKLFMLCEQRAAPPARVRTADPLTGKYTGALFLRNINYLCWECEIVVLIDGRVGRGGETWLPAILVVWTEIMTLRG